MRRPISWVRRETMYAIDPYTPMAPIRSPAPGVNPSGTPHKPSAKMDRQRDGSLATGAMPMIAAGALLLAARLARAYRSETLSRFPQAKIVRR